MTGLIVQPIIGSMSDRTWNALGHRQPYFLTGAILSSIALFFMPDSPALWVATSMLWVLDASINISMEPFRAFVADKLPPEQRKVGFVMQSFFIGIGAAIANALPAILDKFGVTGNASNGIPLSVMWAFKLGAAAFCSPCCGPCSQAKSIRRRTWMRFNERRPCTKPSTSTRRFCSSVPWRVYCSAWLAGILWSMRSRFGM